MSFVSSEPKSQLHVYFLGGFNAKYEGMPLFNHAERSKQVINLLAYLLINRHKNISQESLIEALWPDESSEDPANALKNLIYRLRKILAGNILHDYNACIVQRGGVYSWNTDISCVIDTEEMEDCWKKATSDKLSVNERIELYKRAISLYKGRFMADLSYDGWTVPISSYLQTLYINCIKEVISLLISQKRYEEIKTICETAIAFEPYEEMLHENLLRALINLDKKNKALDHYNNISKKFYKDLGVKLCDSIRNLHEDLTKDFMADKTDILSIKDEMIGSVPDNGAFFCDFEIFKHFYRLEARTAERAGQSVFLCLFTLSSTQNNNINNTVLIKAMDKLQDCIVSSLRRGDVVARYSPVQFMVLIPVSYENGEKVIGRILQRFKKVCTVPYIKIDVNLEPIIS